jgi:hypothetical protein
MLHDLPQHSLLESMPSLVDFQQNIDCLPPPQQLLCTIDDVLFKTFDVDLEKDNVITSADSVV